MMNEKTETFKSSYSILRSADRKAEHDYYENLSRKTLMLINNRSRKVGSILVGDLQSTMAINSKALVKILDHLATSSFITLSLRENTDKHKIKYDMSDLAINITTEGKDKVADDLYEY